MSATDDDADWLFDPRSELTKGQQRMRTGQMLLEALADTQSGQAAVRTIETMRIEELQAVALMSTIHQKRAMGMTDEQFRAWIEGPDEAS